MLPCGKVPKVIIFVFPAFTRKPTSFAASSTCDVRSCIPFNDTSSSAMSSAKSRSFSFESVSHSMPDAVSHVENLNIGFLAGRTDILYDRLLA